MQTVQGAIATWSCIYHSAAVEHPRLGTRRLLARPLQRGVWRRGQRRDVSSAPDPLGGIGLVSHFSWTSPIDSLRLRNIQHCLDRWVLIQDGENCGLRQCPRSQSIHLESALWLPGMMRRQKIPVAVKNRAP